jgi:hypothetical protein
MPSHSGRSGESPGAEHEQSPANREQPAGATAPAAPPPLAAENLYADVLAPAERAILAAIVDRGLADEIAVIRLQIRRILQRAREQDEDLDTPPSNPSATAHDLAKLTAALVRALRVEMQRGDDDGDLQRLVEEVANEILTEQYR